MKWIMITIGISAANPSHKHIFYPQLNYILWKAILHIIEIANTNQVASGPALVLSIAHNHQSN